MSVKCWASVDGAGQYPFSPSQYFILPVPACWQYEHDALNQSWVNVGPGGGPRVVVSTAAFHARVRGSVPGLSGLKETKNVSSPSTCESQYCGEPP